MITAMPIRPSVLGGARPSSWPRPTSCTRTRWRRRRRAESTSWPRSCSGEQSARSGGLGPARLVGAGGDGEPGSLQLRGGVGPHRCSSRSLTCPCSPFPPSSQVLHRGRPERVFCSGALHLLRAAQARRGPRAGLDTRPHGLCHALLDPGAALCPQSVCLLYTSPSPRD